MPDVYVRPELLYAWHGQSLLVVNTRGDCADDQTLSGYFFRETRYLRMLRLLVNGQPPWLCASMPESPTDLRFDYVHPELREFGGGGSGQSGDEVATDADGIAFRTLDMRLHYRIGVASLRATLRLGNRGASSVALRVSWSLTADFADLMEAHGSRREQHGEVLRDMDWDGTAPRDSRRLVRFRYAHPELPFETRICAAGGDRWHATDDGIAAEVVLAPQAATVLAFDVRPVDYRDPLTEADMLEREEACRRWKERFTRVITPGHPLPEMVLATNLRDVASFPLLQGPRDEWLTPQAGIPLYPAVFGRDSMTAGWQAALTDCGESLDASLTCLGRLQGTRSDDWTDEEPGRIPFQLRQGPLARLKLNPYATHYADFASPLMFVIALAHLYSWTGRKESLERHWDVARRILDWARESGDRDGDGYLEYLTRSAAGPKHQGWKDSGHAIMYEDGSPVPTPLGTCELQGYWFAAQQLFAVLSWVRGDDNDAKEYWRAAMDLKARFNRDWWVEEDSCVALAMDPDKRLVRGVASNASHCIASGIVLDRNLPPLIERLFAPDMCSGWGVRTLSSDHVAYNPTGYHLGSVWPVENATLVFGLRRFGFDVRAVELSRALFDLATLYPGYRIPEAVGGYPRSDSSSPGAYPRANSPQLWNASGFSLILHSLLGLQPVAPLDILVVDPVLPAWLPEVRLADLRIAGATVTLRFWRDEHGASHAEVLRQEGTLRLVRQPPPESLSAGLGDRFSAFVDGLWHRRRF